jgi:hypothetical protein
MMRTFVLVALAAVSQASQATECTREQGYAAESTVDYLDSWSNVYLFFEQYEHCYDAAVAEGVNDKIQQLWEHHWDDLPAMIELTSKDAVFKDFIWRRIEDEDFPLDSFQRVVGYATSRCPTVAKEFCDAVISASYRAPPNNALERERGQ